MQTVQLHGKTAAGRVALVDDEDFELVMQYRWSVREVGQSDDRHSLPYASAYVPAAGDRKRGSILMHNLIMGIAGVDHANGNTLDNQRSNLRPATQDENCRNRRKKLNTSSRYKGVTWHKPKQRWRALISVGGCRRHLGSFTSEIEAARAYDTAAREAYGEFACVNFPRPGERGALDLADSESMTAAAPPGDGPYVPDQPGSSRYRGVHWENDSQKWCAKFKQAKVGRYGSEIQAAIAYDAAALAALGPAADLNFPGGVDQQTRDVLAEAGTTVEAVEATVGRGRAGGLEARWSEREAVTHVCEQCGSEYESRATNKSRYCGRSCADKAAYARNREAGRLLVPREEAERAARLYTEAVESGSRAVQKAVMEGLGCSRTRASVAIRGARDLGLLGDTGTLA